VRLPKDTAERHRYEGSQLLVCVAITPQPTIRAPCVGVFLDESLGERLHDDRAEGAHPVLRHHVGITQVICALPPRLPLGMGGHTHGQALLFAAERRDGARFVGSPDESKIRVAENLQM
jgi:hypothetical protein